MQKSRLKNLDLSSCDLFATNFTKATLIGVKMKGMNLNECIFNSSNLKNADLSNASLIKASFRKADISNTNFMGSNVSMAFDLEHAINVGQAIGL